MSLFQTFPRPVGEIGLGAFSTEGPTVTLEDLTQLDVRVTWDEAVSIVEELCVAAQGLVMRPIPAARDIILNANGTVAFRQSAAGVPDPVEAARRLHDLLGGSVAPAPLRLFVSQAVSSGTYNSVAEFGDALAYYAKPGRQERVKAVYQRVSDQLMSKPQSAMEPTQPRAVAATPPTQPRAVAAPPPPPYATPALSHQSRRQLALVGLAAAGLVSIVFGLGLYLWPSASSTSPAATPTETVLATPADAAGVAAPAGVAAGVDQAAAVGSAGQPVARTSSALDAAQIPLTGSRAALRYVPGSGWSRQGTRASATASGIPALPSVAAAPAGGARTDAARVPPQPQQTRAVALPAASAPVFESSAPTPIYSASDATVQPAALTKQQLLPPAYPEVAGKPIRLELIISPAGSVERARFLEAPARMADMMILSSAKNWQFMPAVKDGQPVRYRTVLSWASAP